MTKLAPDELRKRILDLVKNLRNRGEDPSPLLGAIAAIDEYRDKAKELMDKLVAVKISAVNLKPGETPVLINRKMIEKIKQTIEEAENFINQFISKEEQSEP